MLEGQQPRIFQHLIEVTCKLTDEITTLICQATFKLTVLVPIIKGLWCYVDASVTTHPKTTVLCHHLKDSVVLDT